ncbi:hypothetical protein [Nodularia spumigena]|uniref:hypothetical protein n=1 Tax=Nodularia spumigena TaxID=70799 RepID=UPI00232DCF4A|nr:hypothetical protein [Nodularia spumigena]
MANITISNLHPAGADLFSDSESYMTDISEDELRLQGGVTVTTFVGPLSLFLLWLLP